MSETSGESAVRPWWQLAAPGVAVGAACALVGLDRRSLWLDEAYTLGAVHQLRRTLPETSGTMALYYLLLRGWTALGESVWWMRALSVVAAVAALVVTVALARRLLGPVWATVTGVVLGLAPLWVAYAQEARSYALVMLLGATSWLALDHGLVDAPSPSRRRWWWLHTAVVVLLPLAHGLALLLVVPQAVVVAAARAGRDRWLLLARGVAGAAAVTVGLLALGGESVGDWVSPLSAEQLGGFVGRVAHDDPVLAALLVALAAVGGVVAVRAAVGAPTPADRARALVPLAWGVGPIALLAAVSVVRPSFIPRYAVGAAPGLALLLVVAGRAAAQRSRLLGVAVLLVVVGASAVGRLDRATSPDPAPWRQAAARVAAGAEPGDTVLMAVETTTRPAFEAAWREVDPAAAVAVVATDRPLGEVRRFEPDATANDERWDAARATGRLWVVGDTRRLELDRLDWLTTGHAGLPPSHRELARWEVDGDADGIVVVLLGPLPG